MAGDHASGETSTDWTRWLGWLQGSTDPLGVRELLERSARSLDTAQTPADALKAIAQAVDEERASQRAGLAQFDEGLRQWADALRRIAPLLPDTPAADTPALGPYPRRQALLTDLTTQSQAYQRALAEHLDSVTALAERCTGAFRDDLTARFGEPSEALATVAPDTLLERWSAVAEPGYEAWLAEPQTQARIAALINAWSALAETLRGLTDECLETLGLPSARGLDDLAAELQRQRRRHRQDMAALREEIAALRARLDGSDS